MSKQNNESAFPGTRPDLNLQGGVEGDDSHSVCKSPSPETIQYRWHVSKKLDVPSYTLVDGYATPASEAAPAGRELSCLKLIPVHAHDIVRLRPLIRVPNDDDHSCRLRNFTCDDVPSETFFRWYTRIYGVKSTFRSPFVLYEVFVNGPSLPPGPREDPAM